MVKGKSLRIGVIQVLRRQQQFNPVFKVESKVDTAIEEQKFKNKIEKSKGINQQM
jgi:hypothetical protein